MSDLLERLKKKYAVEDQEEILPYKMTTRENTIQELSKRPVVNRNISNEPVKKANNLTLWDTVKGIANGMGKTTENTWLGLVNGVKSARQTLNRAMTSNWAHQQDLFLEQDKQKLELYKKKLEKHPEKSEKLIPIIEGLQNNINNPLISGDNLRKGTEELNEKIQEEKQRNTEKIQENADKMNTRLGKYLAGDIMPAVGQMIPGLAGGGVGTAYFISSATGNYYDDAKQRGMNNEEAIKYSGIMGIIEGSLESVGAKLTTNVGKELFKKNLKGALVNYGLDIGENFLEESIVEPISELVAQTTAGKEKANWDNIGERFLRSGIDGAVTSLITGGASGLIGHAGARIQGNKYSDIQTGKTLNRDSQNVMKQAENIIKQNNTANMEQENSNLVNDKQILYNGINKNGSDINGEIQGRRMAELSRQYDTRVQQKSEQQSRQYTRQEYQEWENNITPTEESKLTDKQRQVKDTIKRQYNKDIVFFDDNNYYNAGSSLIDKNKIYINSKQAETFGVNKVALHEIAESNILHNREISNDIIKPAIEKIINDSNFEKQKQEFWKNQNDDMPSDYAIAKDILCDRFAEVKSGENLDYKNILSQETNMTIDYALDNFNHKLKEVGAMDSDKLNNFPEMNAQGDTAVTSFINNSIPQNNNSVKNDTITNNSMQNIENNAPTKGEIINWGDMERPQGKIRKHYRSIIESSNTTKEAKAIAREMMGTDTYRADSNKRQLERANKRIENSTPDSELNSLMSRARAGEKIDATDIAVGERLIQYYSKIGDKAKLRDSIQATALAGTTAGQTVQAMALLNHQTPEGQVVWIQRSIEKINNEIKNKKGDKAQQFDFTPEMQEKILNSKNKAELEQNLDEVYKELGQQVHKSLGQQIDSWRYFAMLGNPRTHIRNIVGNFLMGRAQGAKNKVAGAIEGTVSKFNPEMERTHTIILASKEVLEYAKNDIKNVASELELNENKYHPQSRIESNMRTFKSDAMENTLGKLFNINDTALQAEDGWGLKAGYKKALAEYMTANKLTPKNITDSQLAKARKYAVQQAKEATFHQANGVASAVNSFINKNKGTKAVGDAVLPFVKTPANIAVAGVQYSPVGLTKSLIYDSIQLRKGNITVNQYIDNISKGLTGSAITVLGFALAQAGVLKASGSDDDKKEKFDQQSGKQAYSIQIGDNTYTIDWLAPVGIPLMVGAEIYEGLSQKTKEKNSKSNDDDEITKQFLDRAEVLANSLSSTLDPMVEMSMISGLTSSIKSFAQNDTEALANMLTNGAKSYLNQFVPTFSGQIAKTTDTVERDTTSTATGKVSKAVDSTINQIKYKIPGLRQTLPTRKDIWGKDVNLADNWAQRFFEAGLLPTSKKQINNDNVVKTLNELYEKNGNSNILPTTINKKIKIDGQDYIMTNSEFNKYKADYGKTSYNLIKNLINTNDFKELSNEQKEKAIENVYTYAKECNKLDYAKNNDLKVEESILYKTMNELKNKGGNQSSYLNYTSKTIGLDKEKEKNEVLLNANYDDNTKSIIYANTTGKDDSLYDILKNGNINIDEYLKYKAIISNESKKKEVYEYVNNNIKGSGNRLLILGKKYKLKDNERQKLTNYINSLYSTKNERIEAYKKLTNNYVVEDGKVYYK